MITCSSCSAQNAPTAAFCDNCGAPLAQAAVPAAASPAAGGMRCPACNEPFTPGQAFCDNCGAALPSAGPVAQGAQPAQAAAAQAPYVPPVSPAPPSAYAPPAPAVSPTLVVLADGYQTTLTGKSVYLIGREDPVSNVFPDLDLGPHGGDEGGVSRQHANLHVQGNQVFIEDLKSTNYTYVNRQRLQPNVRQPLNPGDEIRLGKVVLRYQ